MVWVHNFHIRYDNAKINPNLFTRSETEEYYNTHPEEFTEPVTLHLKSLKFPNGTSAQTIKEKKQQIKTQLYSRL